MDLTTLERLPLWIGGRAVAPTTTRYGEVTNPATGEVIRHVPFANAADVDAAVQAAEGALPGWRAAPALRRARILMRFRDLLERHKKDLAKVVTQEHGKTLADAEGSITRGLEVVEFATGIPHLLKGEYSEAVGTDVDSYSLRQPVGVCVGITPFNFPAMVPLWMFPMAIVCGNAFVLKPSERDPSASLILAQLLKEAGLPDGVFNVVNGDKEAVDALLAHPDVQAISFVGSTPIARYIYTTGTAHGKRVQALGGAKNHAVVMPDADPELAADALVGAAYGSAGERCMAISVAVFVGDKIADDVLGRVQKKIAAMKVGASDDKNAEMGPLVTAAHRDKVKGYIDSGAAEGASLVVDGRDLEVPGHEEGYFVGPTLFDRVTPQMKIYKDEIFGPVLSSVRAKSYDEALGLVNAHEFGNGAAIFTRDGNAARDFVQRVQIGMVGVNVPIPVPVAFHSFGGWKSSLFGDHHIYGPESVRFYTRQKAVTQRWPASVRGGAEFHMPTTK